MDDYGPLMDLLSRRGPDYKQTISFDVGPYEVWLFSSVLDLRGCNLVKQPIITGDDFLQFNGELYEIEDCPEVSGDLIEPTENDGLYLMQKLADCSDEQSILDVLSSLRGEFSFTYWSTKLKTLYFCRDYFGRRSLCWNIDWNTESELFSGESSLEVASLEYNFCISSVAYYGDQQRWTEIPATGVYKLCLQNEHNQTHRVQLIPWQLSRSTDLESDASQSPQESPQPEAVLRSPIKQSFAFNLLDSDQIQNENVMTEYELEFLRLLRKAVQLRVTKQNFRCRECTVRQLYQNQTEKSDQQPTCTHACLAVLFSGGLDSTVLALLANEAVPNNRPIDLINLAFSPNAPDRQTGWASYMELRKIAPGRVWNFIAVDVTAKELADCRERMIKKIIYPLNTVLDDSIGCAIFFAGSGKGKLIQEHLATAKDTNELVGRYPSVDYETKSKVLLLGQGADEQLAGYSRHRNAFKAGGWSALQSEMSLDICRISSRNLGRDDRVISTSGREARYPFLDEEVVGYLNGVPTNVKCDPSRPRGEGEKRLLRLVAARIGLTECCRYEKRAIQFGSKIARLEKKNENAANVSDRLV